MARTEVEVITSERRRRHWSRADKERIVAAALQPGATILGVARTFGVHSSQVFRWRQAVRQGGCRARLRRCDDCSRSRSSCSGSSASGVNRGRDRN
ncbi:transposase [Bradyrhizobium denitrificans]|uniref:Transposase n=1 Tax=Bradyrhizobium denitrificans TaxID=2734912 RepID=A0ABS5G4A8_9BRAD|nr:transposase [Bradyrhizobium denitrificans]NPU22325.1 transposase [Bradyrhizobium sp. LMG 8443]